MIKNKNHRFLSSLVFLEKTREKESTALANPIQPTEAIFCSIFTVLSVIVLSGL
jgi:hypothetical protein